MEVDGTVGFDVLESLVKQLILPYLARSNKISQKSSRLCSKKVNISPDRAPLEWWEMSIDLYTCTQVFSCD